MLTGKKWNTAVIRMVEMMTLMNTDRVKQTEVKKNEQNTIMKPQTICDSHTAQLGNVIR